MLAASELFFGGSAVAAMIAGAVALFAPCCISVMLPAYFATAAQNRRMLVAMTFLFAAGVATIILPLALGAAFVQRVLIGQHTIVYTVAGVILVALAAYTFLGGRMHLPMPGRRAGGRAGPLSVYTLGAFSGVASACCAPVLAGVLALSGAAASFGAALGLGTAFVFGMVAPLFVISLMWDRYDWSSSRLFRPRQVSLRIGPWRRSLSGTALASSTLLLLMGLGTLYIGLFRDAMATPGGWQESLSAELQHYGSVLTKALDFVPSWAGAVLLGLLLLLLARLALRQVSGPSYGDFEHADPDLKRADPIDDSDDSRPHEAATKEVTHEQYV